MIINYIDMFTEFAFCPQSCKVITTTPAHLHHK